MPLTISGDSHYQIPLSEFIAGNIRVKNNKEARRLFIFRNKTFSEGDSGASFDKRVYLKEKECENITDTVSGIGTGNNDIQIYYGLRYSSNKDDNKQVEAQFAYDKQFIRNQCKQDGLDYELIQTINGDYDVRYKLTINNPQSNQNHDDLTSQLENITIEQTTGTDKVENVVRNPDSVSQIWNAYKSYLERVANNEAQDSENIYSYEQMNIGSVYISTRIIFQPSSDHRSGVKIILLVRPDEESSSSEMIAKETTDKINIISSQCEEAGLSFSCHKKIKAYDNTDYKETTYIMTIRDQISPGCSIL